MIEDLLSVVEDVPLNSKVELTLLRKCDERRREKVWCLAVDRSRFQTP
jgi:hypothetical protein